MGLECTLTNEKIILMSHPCYDQYTWSSYYSEVLLSIALWVIIFEDMRGEM